MGSPLRWPTWHLRNASPTVAPADQVTVCLRKLTPRAKDHGVTTNVQLVNCVRCTHTATYKRALAQAGRKGERP